MDKEIIELLKSLSSNAETVLIWYMALDFAKVAIGWIGFACAAYWAGRGLRGLNMCIDGSLTKSKAAPQGSACAAKAPQSAQRSS